jgi:hypothetical protein
LRQRLIGLIAGMSGFALVAGASGVAHAQAAIESVFQRDRNVGVRERPRPAYDAIGARSGAFLILPRVEASAAYEDNIFATETNEVSDEIFSVLPSITAQSQWSRHALQARVEANRFQYAENTTQNNTSYLAGVSGRLDVVRGAEVTSAVTYEHLVEPRSSQSSPAAAREPVEYDQFSIDLGASRELNRYRISGGLRYRSYDFSDTISFAGSPIDMDFRNNSFWEGQVRADYALSPALAIYATGIAHSWAFKQPSLVGDLDRDASGYQIAGGADFEISNLVRGQIQAGVLHNKFDDPRAGSTTGLGLQGRVEYFPTQLLTVELTADRTVQSTGLVGAAGVNHTGFGVRGDYELLRNVILTARAGRLVDNFQGLDRKDRIWTATLGANVLVNRRVGVNLLYTRYNQDSSGLARGADFAVNRVQVGLVLQY